MRGFVRVVVGTVIAVSLGFIWTVGQGGLKATNRNLCDLWAALPLPAYQSCEFQNVLVYAVLCIGGLGVIWIVIEILAIKAVRRKLAKVPAASKELWAKLEPYLIVIGLIVMLIGAATVGYAAFRQASDNKILKDRLAQPPAITSIPAAALEHQSATTTTATLPTRQLSRADYEKRSRLIIEFFQLVNTPVRGAFDELWGIYNDEPRLINSNQKGVYDTMVSARAKVIEADKGLNPLVRESELYPDIRGLNWNFQQPILNSLNELINKLRVPVQNGTIIFIDSKETDQLKQGIDGLGKWIEDTKSALNRIRADDDTAVIATNVPAGGAPPSSSPAPPRYTPYEKEQRLRAVDEIYNVVATQLQPTYSDGNKLLDQIYSGPVPSDAEQRLTEYRNRVQAAFDDLNGLQKKYNYFPDIVQVAKKNTFNDVEATHGVGNLIPEIQDLRQKAPNDISWFLLRDTTMMDARNQMRRFDQYLSDTTKGLQEKRAEIEKAEVYSGQ